MDRMDCVSVISYISIFIFKTGGSGSIESPNGWAPTTDCEPRKCVRKDFALQGIGTGNWWTHSEAVLPKANWIGVCVPLLSLFSFSFEARYCLDVATKFGIILFLPSLLIEMSCTHARWRCMNCDLLRLMAIMVAVRVIYITIEFQCTSRYCLICSWTIQPTNNN